MKPYNMHWIRIDNLTQAAKELTQIGLEECCLSHMARKTLTKVIKLEKVPPALAQLLKQEMLSLGGDAAVNKELFVNGVHDTDVVLLGNYNQLYKLVNIMEAQPVGLKKAAQALNNLLQTLERSQDRILSCRGISLELGERTTLMGILNITPNSFAEGGRYNCIENAVKQAQRLIEDGADILDIGAETTRLGYSGISAEEEWARLEPVLRELTSGCPIPISVDTQKAIIAEKALSLGVQIINDIWGLQKDPKMAKIIGGSQAAVVIMHNRNNTEYENMMSEILAFLEQSIETALKAGIKDNQIIIDPGIGFGKTPQQNMEIVGRLVEFRSLGFPLLLGASCKSVIDRALNPRVEERLESTIALNTLGIAAGADIIRVHNLLANKTAAMMADHIIREKEERTREIKTSTNYVSEYCCFFKMTS